MINEANNSVVHEERLLAIKREFEDVFSRCPEDAMGRQKIIEERRNGHVYVQIITSFKLTVP